MKNLKLTSTLFLWIFIGFSTPIFSQCPTTNIAITTQAEIDDFATTYPNCTVLTEGIMIEGADIVNLNGLSGIEMMESYLVIGATSITSYAGLENITFIDEAYLGNNPNLTSTSGLEGLVEADVLWFGADNATDYSGLANLTTVNRQLSIGGAQLTSLQGLNKLTQVGSGSIVDRLSIGGSPLLTSLAGLEALTTVKGRFRIVGLTGLTDLTGLDKLERVENTFEIKDNAMLTSLNGLLELNYCTHLQIENNAILPNLQGLSNLNNIDELTIINSPGLNNLIGMSSTLNIDRILIENNSLDDLQGMEGLTSVDYFDILNSPDLMSLNGLDNLEEVSFFVIQNNDGLTSMAGLTGLTNIVEEFTITENDNLVNLVGLDNLGNVGNGIVGYDPFFSISNNAALEHLSGLDNLLSVDGRFLVGGNPALVDMTGLATFSFARDFSISNNASLENLNGLSSYSIAEDRLSIRYNPALTTLAALTAFNHVPSEKVYLEFNDLLSFCAVDGICDLIENNINKIRINSNATGCDSKSQVASACLLSLPVELTYLQASLHSAKQVVLQWATQTEVDNSHFTVRHSIDGQHWKAIEIVNGAGNSSTLQQYQIIDSNASEGINYYQLEQMDFSGQLTYSNTVSIEVARSQTIVSPNPAKDKIRVEVKDGNVLTTIELINLLGQTVYAEQFPNDLALSEKEISIAHFSPGWYYLNINNESIPRPLIIR